jgi:type I restriction enzyme S subunit
MEVATSLEQAELSSIPHETEVKPGYKQTEVGIIPDEWDVESMLGLSLQIMDYRGRTPKKLGMEWGGGDIPALSAGNVKQGFIDLTEECYFGSEKLYKRWMTRGDVAKDDILFTTEAPLGNVALVPDDRKYILSQRTILLKLDPERASSRYLFQVMLSDGFQRVLADYASGSTAKGIQRKKFEQLCVALPPPPEQRVIAEVLRDVDALLDRLNRLIIKKRDLKQAAMQQLLTGQIRLPGFHGKWEKRTIRCVVQTPVTDGPHLTPEFLDDGIPFLSVNNLVDNKIDLNDLRFISKEDDQEFSKKCKPQKGDILLGKAASVGKVAIVDTDFNFNIWSPIALIRVKAAYDSRFVYYQLQTSGLAKQIALLTNSSSQGNIGMGDIEKLRLQLPSGEEQSAVAEVLNDMDAELAVLEQRRNKTRDLKQAMMQELLTGNTRLV